MEDPRIREAAANLESQIGTVYTDRDLVSRLITDKLPSWQCFNTEASGDHIRRFVDGIGDLNPLYRDEEYARKTRFGGLVAPPLFLYSVIFAENAYMGLGHGIHPFGSGADWEWARPIHVDDQISWRAVIPSAVEVKKSRFAGETLFIYNELEYLNQRGETLAWKKEWNICASREKAVEAAKYRGLTKIHEYSTEDIDRIRADRRREEIRGATPRYWEDVEVGETVPWVVHGPVTGNEIICWTIGCGTFINRSDRIWRPVEEAIEEAGFWDSTLKVWINGDMTHFYPEFSARVGVPGADAFAPQLMTWLGMPLTNWAGDDGFLWKLHGELRQFVVVGDTLWIQGKVTRKYCEDEGSESVRRCVDIDLWSDNQRGEQTMRGKATMLLPSRSQREVTYPLPHHLPA